MNNWIVFFVRPDGMSEKDSDKCLQDAGLPRLTLCSTETESREAELYV